MWSNSVAKTLISSSNFGVLQVLLPLLVGVEVVLSSLLVSGHVLIGRTLSLAGELVLNCNRTKSKPELTIFYDTTSSWPDLALALAPALAWTGPLASESAGSLLSFSSLSRSLPFLHSSSVEFCLFIQPRTAFRADMSDARQGDTVVVRKSSQSTAKETEQLRLLLLLLLSLFLLLLLLFRLLLHANCPWQLATTQRVDASCCCCWLLLVGCCSLLADQH